MNCTSNPIILLATLLILATTSCKRLPEDAATASDTLRIVPDYREICIPCNLAPLNFSIGNEGDAFLVRIQPDKGQERIIKGRDVCMNLKDWKQMLEENKGGSYRVEAFARREGKWFRYPVFSNRISSDSIDSYVVYRSIQPLYTTYEEMSIVQRNLENFEETTLMDNRLVSTEKEAHCINCHSFQNYNRTNRMQLHVRGPKGGTVLVDNGEHQKVNPKAKGLPAGVVYPSWHPTLPLIAYSINTIGQNFHTSHPDKVEVMDSKSDLILYDPLTNRVTPVTSTSDQMETFPYWSPDGKYLYYVSARFSATGEKAEATVITHYQEIRYDLYRMPFYAENRTFGPAELMLDASALGKSATFPRVSPDGRFLLFTMGNIGNFHIWHKSSDLYLMDLQTRVWRSLSEVNGPGVDSYHSWSSNGRWIVFSSRRDDGDYTRFYLVHVQNGVATKPFVLPQKKPDYYQRCFRSYNIPEFIVKPASSDKYRMQAAIGDTAVSATLTDGATGASPVQR